MTCLASILRVSVLLAIRRLFPLHVNDAEVELWNGDTAALNDSPGAADRWILAQPILREQPVVLLLQAVGLLAVLIRLLQQFEEGSFALIRLLELRLELFIKLLLGLEVIVQGVEVIDELLVVLKRDVRLRLLDVVDFALVASELLFDLFDHTLVVLYLLLDLYICDAFSRVARLLLRLLANRGGLYLLGEAQLDQPKHGGQLRVSFADVRECL